MSREEEELEVSSSLYWGGSRGIRCTHYARRIGTASASCGPTSPLPMGRGSPRRYLPMLAPRASTRLHRTSTQSIKVHGHHGLQMRAHMHDGDPQQTAYSLQVTERRCTIQSDRRVLVNQKELHKYQSCTGRNCRRFPHASYSLYVCTINCADTDHEEALLELLDCVTSGDGLGDGGAKHAGDEDVAREQAANQSIKRHRTHLRTLACSPRGTCTLSSRYKSVVVLLDLVLVGLGGCVCGGWTYSQPGLSS